MTLRQWFTDRLRRFRHHLTPSPVAWKGAGYAFWAAAIVLFMVILATNVFIHFSWQKLFASLAITGLCLLIGALSILMLHFLSLLPSGYRRTLILLTPFIFMGAIAFINIPPLTQFILFAALIIVTGLVGGTIAVFCSQGVVLRKQKVTLLSLAVGIAILLICLVGYFRQGEEPNPALTDYHLEDRTLNLPDPAAPGPFEVFTLTYGTGEDQNRPEFGASVDLLSHSVDGSKMIGNWDGISGWLRSKYWGFDAKALPLQGRIWYPRGNGPFPLVLIVHGNHGMEDYSDPGYAYLGELLASRGYILVSVDENFINGSFIDAVDFPGSGLTGENDARGWLLLEHFKLWRQWNQTEDHTFFGKVDFERLALIGHSRGGEAVVHAAAFNRLSHYPDNATIEFDYDFNIRGIIAIAPSDGQYKPRGQKSIPEDINYFVIQGSLDGDVQSFTGSSQYSRIGFTGDLFHFKSSLYVLGANHGQFNTSWGRNDFPGHQSWILDTRPIMEPEDQRRIAEVYFSAFLDVVCRDQDAYRPIFYDSRFAAAWLPDVFYLNNYADAQQQWLASFEEDLDPGTATFKGGRIETSYLTKWRESWVRLKSNALETHAAIVAWDKKANPENASYRLTFPSENLSVNSATALVCSLSTANEGTMPEDWEPEVDDKTSPPDEPGPTDGKPKPLDWTVVLTDVNHERAALSLGSDHLLYPQIQTVTRRARFLNKSKPSEVVFRQYTFPLADFKKSNPQFDPSRLTSIEFLFDKSEKGAIVIDDIGLMD